MRMVARAAEAQVCPMSPYFVETAADSETMTPYLSKGGQSCSEGSYVRTGQAYTADFVTHATGSCNMYTSDPFHGTCNFVPPTQYHGIGASTISEAGVGGYTTVYPNPNNWPLDVDTRPSNTSSPDVPPWMFNTEGNRTLNFHSNLYATGCYFHDGVDTAVHVTALKCVPEWNKSSQQALVHSGTGQNVLVRVPTGMNSRMKTGISAAITAWNNALDSIGTGVGARYEYVESDTPCGGTFCINTQIGSVNQPTECAHSNPTVDPATGLITSSTITFPSDTSTWPQNFDTRLAAHELVHHLGLGENLSSCQSADSLMRPATCGASSGYPTAPTTSDLTPVAQSTYQGATTATCQ